MRLTIVNFMGSSTQLTVINPETIPPLLMDVVALQNLDEKTSSWVIAEAGPDVRFLRDDIADARLVIYGENYREDLQSDLTNSSGAVKAALCLQTQSTDSYLDLLHMHVRHIIFPQSVFAGDAVRLALRSRASLRHTLRGKNVLAGVILTDEPLAVITRKLSTLDDMRIIPEMMKFLTVQHFPSGVAENACLAIKEAVTNAVFHGFREKGTHFRKYQPETFERLEDGDEVSVTITAMPRWAAVKIRDNGGCLGPLSVANSLDRHRSERGLYDHRGRGFHLMRHLAHRIVVVIDRGVSTTVELYFLHETDGMFERHFELVEL